MFYITSLPSFWSVITEIASSHMVREVASGMNKCGVLSKDSFDVVRVGMVVLHCSPLSDCVVTVS